MEYRSLSPWQMRFVFPSQRSKVFFRYRRPTAGRNAFQAGRDRHSQHAKYRRDREALSIAWLRPAFGDVPLPMPTARSAKTHLIAQWTVNFVGPMVALGR